MINNKCIERKKSLGRHMYRKKDKKIIKEDRVGVKINA